MKSTIIYTQPKATLIRRMVCVLFLCTLFCVSLSAAVHPKIKKNDYPISKSKKIQTLSSERNLALNRAAYHSSCINFDNTAHLVTDGSFKIRNGSVVTASNTDSPLGEEKERVFDGSNSTKFLTFHPNVWLQYDFSGEQAYPINEYTLTSANDVPERDPKNWTFQGSNDGKDWVTLDTRTNSSFAKRSETQAFSFTNSTAYKAYRLNITANHGAPELQLSEINMFEGEVSRIDKSTFSSEWISQPGAVQWVYIDLGIGCDINRVKLYWDEAYAKAYQIEVSNDLSIWQSVYSTTSGDGGQDDISFSTISSRYVRLLATSPSGNTGYSLIEFEVYGTGGLQVAPLPMPSPLPDGTQYLTGGNWKLQRAENVTETGAQIAQANFEDRSWITAAVPGTILTSYLNIGAIPDPNFGDQQLQISDAFFTADFWYRNSFVVPASYAGKKVWLNFNGINWKADVYVNGHNLGQINGAFIRKKFDITTLVTPGATASLAIYIHKNATPGAVTLQNSAGAGPNGGALGADNPTIHSSVGWDWLPTIRGRNTGIQDDVYLSCSQNVLITDPFVTTDLPLPGTSFADLTLKVDVQNTSATAVTGILKGTITPGNITFSQNVSLNGLETKNITIDKSTISQMTIINPMLWWPNGYGAQNMYKMALEFEMEGDVSDRKEIPFGIREITPDYTNNVLSIYVNGKRIFMRGGNWGLSESMLRLDKEGYDVRVRLHKEENFTMIRNWVGMTGDDDFYDACDKYGIMIWDDFWLANPSDGPDPDDPAMFMENAIDKIKRFRNHPSIALYCGRNEGNPPATLASKLVEALTDFDGTRPYIPHSADNLVSGFGPYSVQNPKWYFQNRSGQKLHSEMGMPNIPSVESMKAMMPADKLWPINDMWGIHDYCNSAQGASAYTSAINTSYGTARDIDDFCLKAQMVNMENHKAMFEPFAASRGNGMLMWMSQSAWPSTVWQTYDYYLEQTAGYYGCKKACEPLHILWDCNLNVIKVSNNTGQDFKGLKAVVQIFNLDGTLKYADSVLIDALADKVTRCFTLSFPLGLSSTHFIKLKLMRDKVVLSDNFYWRGNTYQNYTALSGMNEVLLKGALNESVTGTTHTMTARISNPGPDVALMIRLKMLKNPSNERVLPTFYSDNYFSLLPGESKLVTMEYDSRYLGSENPKLVVEGWNIHPFEVTDKLDTNTDIQVVDKPLLIGLSPNPVDDVLYVSGLSDFEAEVFDLSGKKIIQKGAHSDSINVSNLSTGVYLLQLSCAGETYAQTFVKL